MTEAEFRDIDEESIQGGEEEEDEESLSCEVDVEVLLQLSKEVGASDQSSKAWLCVCLHTYQAMQPHMFHVGCKSGPLEALCFSTP